MSLTHQALQLGHSGVVLKNVANHQDATVPAGDLDQFFTIGNAQCQRLFYEYVFAVFEGCLGKHVMLTGWRSHNHGLQVIGREYVLDF